MALKRPHLLLAFFVLAGLALWLRTYGLLAKPLWLDEAYSAFAADHDYAFLWQVVPQYETHPPVYYSLLHSWTLIAGDSLAALRGFGVIGGMLAIVAVLAAAHGLMRMLGADPGQRTRMLFVAGLLAALSPSLVEMSREVRPYPWLILSYGAALTSLFGLVTARDRGKALGGTGLAAYLASVLALLWLHNLGVLYAVTMTLGGVVLLRPWRWSWPEWRRVLVGHMLVALLWLPGLLILAQQSGGWIAKTWLSFKPELIGRMILGIWSTRGTGATFITLCLMGAGFLACWQRARTLRPAIALLIFALGPPMLAALISMMIAPVFLPRTLTPVAVPAILLMAWGATGLTGRGWTPSRWVPLLAAMVLALSMAHANFLTRHRPYWEDWYQVVDLLKTRVRAGDEIWTYPNEAALPLNRALRDRGLHYTVRPLPVPVPAIGVPGRHPTGSVATVSITREELRAMASTPQARRIPTIWTVRQGANAYDPADDLPAVMAEQREEIWRWDRVPIELRGYRRRD